MTPEEISALLDSDPMPPTPTEVRGELDQAESVGHDVGRLREELEKVAPGGKAGDAKALKELYLKTLSLGLPDGYQYIEPSELEGIRAERPDGPRRLDVPPDDELRDRILGAWLGRCAGCLLGKPVEGWRHDRIKKVLEAAGAWPLDDYFPEIKGAEGGFHGRPREWTRGNIKLAPRDDDTDYTVLGLRLLEEKGAALTTRDVADAWLQHLPYRRVYTAERVAYRNLVLGLEPPRTAVYRNPFREWIGAQIRADAFGYACPGLPERAAELAHRDARLSHVANGIYGEMWVAATLAAALAGASPEEAVRIGLSEIPKRSRLAEALNRTLEWSQAASSITSFASAHWEAVHSKIMAACGSLHGVHTINNACIVVMGLACGGGDFGRSISIAVMGGLDTDCNGATAGSILGAVLGARRLPEKWIGPLSDRLMSIVADMTDCRISELAARTFDAAKRILAE